jgi:hypothetical protein
VPAANSSFAQSSQPSGVTLPLTAPSTGVITQILVKHGPSGVDPGTYGFRVLSGSAAAYSTTGAPVELPDSPWPSNAGPGTRPFTPSLGGAPKGIPIGAGERLGMVRIGGTGMQGPNIWSSISGGTLDSIAAVHNSGAFAYNMPMNNELLIQYLIEPDADRDGFGDESQDRCPTNATVQAACPVPPVTPTTPTTKTKKCKRKKKAGAAKKGRCKKKRKKKR